MTLEMTRDKKKYVEKVFFELGDSEEKCFCFFKVWPFPAPFSLFLSFLLNVQLEYKIVPMLGLELRISGVRSDRSTS